MDESENCNHKGYLVAQCEPTIPVGFYFQSLVLVTYGIHSFLLLISLVPFLQCGTSTHIVICSVGNYRIRWI